MNEGEELQPIEEAVLRFEHEHDETYWLEQEEIERKREALLDCSCGKPLIPDPVVTDNGIRIAYSCPSHGLTSIIDPFEGFR